jgi:hypothetical protein
MELGAHTALWDAPELGRDREVEEPEDARRGREMLAAWERTQAATSVEESAGEAGGRGLWVPVLGADEVDDSADADARGGTGGQDASSTRGRGAGKKAAGLEDVDDEEERWARSVGEATPEAGAGVGSSVLCAERPGPSSRAAPAPGPSTPGPSTRVPASSTSGATVVPVVRMETSHAPVAGEAAQVPSTPKQVGAHTPSPGQGLTTPQPAATPGKQEWGSVNALCSFLPSCSVLPCGSGLSLSPPPPSRTNRTRRVPHPVLIGHAASLTPYPGTPCQVGRDRIAALRGKGRLSQERKCPCLPVHPRCATLPGFWHHSRTCVAPCAHRRSVPCCRVCERTKSLATSARRLRRPRRARRNRQPRRRDRRSWERLAGRGHRRATLHHLFWSGSGRRRRAVARAGSRTSTGRCERGAKAARAATTTTTWLCERGREIA